MIHQLMEETLAFACINQNEVVRQARRITLSKYNQQVTLCKEVQHVKNANTNCDQKVSLWDSLNMIRAATLGANDGIISVSELCYGSC